MIPKALMSACRCSEWSAVRCSIAPVFSSQGPRRRASRRLYLCLPDESSNGEKPQRTVTCMALSHRIGLAVRELLKPLPRTNQIIPVPPFAPNTLPVVKLVPSAASAT